jgi:hypothetical protein
VYKEAAQGCYLGPLGAAADIQGSSILLVPFSVYRLGGRFFLTRRSVFIPNNDISPARRMRIKKSVEFGASHAAQWNNNVTHVIVDSDLSFTDVTKYLKIDRFPVSWQRI